MGDVVDARPDRFLRAMRDHGQWHKACEESGMTSSEVEGLCADNPQFDLAQIECQLEFIEDSLIQHTEKAIAEARANRENRIKVLRDAAMVGYKARREAVA